MGIKNSMMQLAHPHRPRLVYTGSLHANREGRLTVDLNNMDDIRAFFAKDEFATKCLGATVDDYDFETGAATVSMRIDDRHHNAQGFVMGGVFFTLADFALAVASNVNRPPCSSVNSSISFMRRVKGDVLKAVAYPDKLGRNLSFFTVNLFDETGRLVARVSTTVMTTNH